MTPDLLAALRETPGCGEDPECIVRHTLAVHHADECDPCLTRLAEAVIEQVVARLPDHPQWDDCDVVDLNKVPMSRATVVYVLLTALRSETPR